MANIATTKAQKARGNGDTGQYSVFNSTEQI